MALAPTMPTLLAGQRPGASYYAALNTYLAFIANPPAASCYRDVLRTMPDGVWDVLNMDGENYDRDGIHTNAQLSRMTIQTDGRYRVRGYLSFAPDPNGWRKMELRGNSNGDQGTGILLARDVRQAVNSSSQGTTLERTCSRVFSAGEYIEIFCYQTSGSSLALDFGIRKCGIEIEWIGTT